VALALKERGLSRDVYDFIAHNWGKGAALVAALSAEPHPPLQVGVGIPDRDNSERDE
jgi:hypothetical protein